MEFSELKIQFKDFSERNQGGRDLIARFLRAGKSFRVNQRTVTNSIEFYIILGN